MARFSPIAFLALFLGAVANAKPMMEQVPIQDDTPVRALESWSYTDCGATSDPIQVQSIKVSPDPPKPGEKLTVTVNAEVTEEVEEGAYADVVVKLGLIKLLSKQFDLCEEARKANATVQCPIKPGQYEVIQSVDLPKEIPKAKFTVSVRGYTIDDDDLACVDLKVDFMKKPFLKGFGW
ncbi:ML domain-containing protein [Pterulicium gracile]|uniref:Phosphatidylglycerol/phosphatidylinositol transfer protein n=1 Tax=Pterulicium gracile TaxID=1884261 RepID=A0A5C3QPR4_9AGAR|nr:ML domain-containing protein [Pterula gracilis]